MIQKPLLIATPLLLAMLGCPGRSNSNKSTDTPTDTPNLAPQTAEFCTLLSSPTPASLNAEQLNEASGVVVATLEKDRLLQVDDSSHQITVTNKKGGVISQFDIKKNLKGEGKSSGWDIEAITLGPCSQAASCVYVGAIGNNHQALRHVFIFTESQVLGAGEQTGDGAFLSFQADNDLDFESLLVFDKDSIFLVSRSKPLTIYRVVTDTAKEEGNAVQLKKIRELSLTPQQEITDVALSPSRDELVLISKKSIYQLKNPMAVFTDESGQMTLDFKVTPMPETLEQPEGVAWVDDTSLLITSEKTEKSPQQIQELVCDSSSKAAP